MTAADHYDYPEYVSSEHGETVHNVSDLIGDNGNTNRALGRLVGWCSVVCHRHRYNLAVKRFLNPYHVVFDRVQCLMKKLSYKIPTAKLQR